MSTCLHCGRDHTDEVDREKAMDVARQRAERDARMSYPQGSPQYRRYYQKSVNHHFRAMVLPTPNCNF